MRPRIALALTAALLAAVALPEATGAAPPPGTDAAGGFDFTRPQVVATGLEVPWGMAFLPDGSALVAERNRARIMRLSPGQAPTVAATVPNVVPTGEAGLLGIAVSPTYAQDSYVYAYFTAASDNRIVRFRLATPQTQEIVKSGIAKASIHDGGRIAFGPDGMLYAGVGDANNTANAQNASSLNGKILRMRPDGTVPPDNPFANSVVYSLGHRNVQGLAWDAQGRLFATEFGQNTTDEVNQIVAGANYGWPTCEGTCADPRFRNPLTTWTTAEASPSGGAIANGTMFVAALRGTRLWLVPLNNPAGRSVELNGAYGRLRTVAVGPDGYLWVATSNRDGRGTPTADDDRVLRFPPTGVDDYAIAANPAAGQVTPGGSVTSTISTSVTSGNPQTVTFSGVSGLPAGTTASFNPPSVPAGGSSTLTLTTSATTPPGAYALTVTATGPAGTRSTGYTLTVGGTGGVVYSDTFETATGWTVNPAGTDTATGGLFERGDPAATTYNGQTFQQGTTPSGTNCLVTGRLAGTAAGDYDLDGGTSSVGSPAIALPSGRTLTLTFRYYLAHFNNSSTSDGFRVKVNGTVVFQKLGAATTVPATWQTGTADLSSYAGQSVRITVEATDGSGASLVEAAVDDVRIA
ncbi:PQQ-dependent sugar dehydrogenase [Longispora sp. NPDC051575]|uniref:PQQ-dependent sugar dehydrogenase n=1 Tax=Longispora sp. NPDC051575 TaxID=3154943 RepID=UPI0034472D0B